MKLIAGFALGAAIWAWYIFVMYWAARALIAAVHWAF